jgi:hypothetical protein
LRSWIRQDQTAFIGVELYDDPYPIDLHNIKGCIAWERRNAVDESDGGIILCELVTISENQVLKVIRKEPNEPSGMNYVSKLVFPLLDAHIILMIKICETGTTGIRDSVVFEEWFEKEGDIESDENGIILGWVKDPYDEGFREGRSMNMSESPEYDKDFPDHPLSEMRRKLDELEHNMIIDTRLQALML